MGVVVIVIVIVVGVVVVVVLVLFLVVVVLVVVVNSVRWWNRSSLGLRLVPFFFAMNVCKSMRLAGPPERCQFYVGLGYVIA